MVRQQQKRKRCYSQQRRFCVKRRVHNSVAPSIGGVCACRPEAQLHDDESDCAGQSTASLVRDREERTNKKTSATRARSSYEVAARLQQRHQLPESCTWSRFCSNSKTRIASAFHRRSHQFSTFNDRVSLRRAAARQSQPARQQQIAMMDATDGGVVVRDRQVKATSTTAAGPKRSTRSERPGFVVTIYCWRKRIRSTCLDPSPWRLLAGCCWGRSALPARRRRPHPGTLLRPSDRPALRPPPADSY